MWWCDPLVAPTFGAEDDYEETRMDLQHKAAQPAAPTAELVPEAESNPDATLAQRNAITSPEAREALWVTESSGRSRRRA